MLAGAGIPGVKMDKREIEILEKVLLTYYR